MGIMKALRDRILKVSHGLAHLELWLCKLLIVLFALLLLSNVLLRYLLNSPLYFAEELAVYMLIWMAFLASASAIARRQMISLTFLTDQLSPVIRKGLAVFVELLIFGMCAILAVVSYQWVTSWAVAFEQALTLGTLKWPFYSIMPTFFILASFHSLANVFHYFGHDPDQEREVA